jgi:hypothetical protein
MMLAARLAVGCTAASSGAAAPARSGGRPVAPGPATPAVHAAAGTVAGELVLPARTLAAGAQMTAAVIVDNNTGHVVTATGCQTMFAVDLSRPGFDQDPGSLGCLQVFHIPVGTSHYTVTVNGRYDSCGGGGIPACDPGHMLPPLPPGDYQATLVQSGQLFSAPAPVPVRLTG